MEQTITPAKMIGETRIATFLETRQNALIQPDELIIVSEGKSTVSLARDPLELEHLGHGEGYHQAYGHAGHCHINPMATNVPAISISGARRTSLFTQAEGAGW